MSFTRETTVKAVRKRHRCDGCLTFIDIGQPAERWAGMTDGEFGTAIYHPECRAAETAYNCDILDVHSGDDWTPLNEIEDESRPWLIEDHPVVAARMGIVAQEKSNG
jgi:hypothetical protein